MAGYLIEDIEDYENLYKATKDKHLKHWYNHRIQVILDKIENLLMKAANAPKLKRQ